LRSGACFFSTNTAVVLLNGTFPALFWNFEGKLPSPPYFLHFFGCKEDDNDDIIVFFCVFLL
jgi:hypothetical protein